MATTFIWKGRSPGGEILSGEYVTENKAEMINYLRKRKIIITSMREKSKDLNLNLALFDRVTTKDLGIFTRQFSTMINAGLPMVQCLEILSSQMDKASFKKVVEAVTNDVSGGGTLAESMSKHEKIFDNLFCNMVEAGEAGGILDLILNRLATYLEKAEALQRKVKAAMMYPSVVAFVAMGATIFMLMFIIPTFAKMFTDFGGDLPLPTKIVMGLSDFLRSKWWLLLAIVGGVVFMFKRFYATEAGHLKVDAAMLKMPVLGVVLRKSAIARFTRTLGTLVSSGVPILNGLDITAKTAGNRVVENAIIATKESISEGNTIAEPLKSCGVFPPMVTQMISVGEQTGALDEMLEKIANFYDDEVDTAVETLTSVIEPIMIVVMGVLVGGMLIAMYMPMFKLINVIGG